MTVKTFVRRTLALLIGLICMAGSAGAQSTGTGAISGTVSDDSGAVMPGVTVTLSSPSRTIGANQQAVTDERGAYQFLRLVPGTYSVKGELQGFRPAEQQNIIVNSDQTARGDLKLSVGSVQEGVTVTGEAPLLDTTTALKQVVLSKDTLEALPNRMDIWSVTRVIPSVTMNKVDTGGSQAFIQSLATVHGTSTESGYFIDGMDVSGQDGNGANAVLYIDPYAMQETNFQVGGAGTAQMAKGGLIYNVISRTGTNTLHGGAMFNGASHSMGSQNFTPELKQQLFDNLTAAAKALAIAQNTVPGNDILKLYDYGGWASGPVMKDRLWFSGSTHIQVLDQYPLGSFDAAGHQVVDDYLMSTTTAKVAWQMTKSAQLSFFDNLHYKAIYHRNGVGNNNTNFSDNLARVLNTKWPNVSETKFTTPIGRKMVMDLLFGRLRDDDRFDPEPELQTGAVSHFDSITNTYTEAWPTYNFNLHSRKQAHASFSYFTSQHDIRFGFGWILNGKPSAIWSTSGMRAVYRQGVPDSVNTYNVQIAPPSEFKNIKPLFTQHNRETGTYIQDKWTPTKKLTINVGLRFETNYGWQDATCQPTTEIFTTALGGGRCFDAIKGQPDLKNTLPRFSAVYDLQGDGRTAIKFAANRYDQPIQMEFVGRLNPVGGTSDTRRWVDQSQCASVNNIGCDLNGDKVPQLNELGPSSGFALGNTSRYAAGLKYPVSNEYSAEVQRQLPWSMVFSAGFTRHELKRNLGQRNAAQPSSSYVPLTVTEVTSARTVTVYNATSRANDNVFGNEPSLDSIYNGWDITLNKRMNHGWSVLGGASVGKTTGDTLGGDLNNPNSQEFRHGIVGNDTPWAYKLSGVYELPYQISVSGTAQYYKGFPETTTVSVGNSTVSLLQGTQSVVVRPRADVRLPNTTSLDMSVRKTFSVQGRKYEPRIDLYNLTNEATITNWLTTLGPTYHRASTVQQGRLIKVGISMEF
jgi:hypothetical protein